MRDDRIGRSAAPWRNVELGRPEEPSRDAELLRDTPGDLFGGAMGRRWSTFVSVRNCAPGISPKVAMNGW